MMSAAPQPQALLDTLVGILGSEAVIADEAERAAYSADVYSRGELCAAVIRPRDKRTLAQAVGATTAAGFAVVPRGGGLSYTGGYTPDRRESVVVDLGALDRIVEIDEADMYVTVEAGVTWKQLHAALAPRGLRAPFFGTFSGAGATVGGGFSNGALFFGTARYGVGADCALGLEVALADGTLLRTGQAAFAHGKPFYRTYGPDLTGLFCHDAGALGVKVEATLRLVRAPEHTDFASFAFDGIERAAAALSEVARSGAAEEAYVFDPASTRSNLEQVDLRSGLKTLAGVVANRPSLVEGLKHGARLIAAGRDFLGENDFSLHIACAGRSRAAVDADLGIGRRIAKSAGGREIPSSIPEAVRGSLFPPLNAVLGPKGDRWVALNAKVPHSDAVRIIRAADEVFARHAQSMRETQVTLSRLLIAISTHAFSFEPVLHWFDEWLPIHRRAPEAAHLAKLREPPPDPAARALVAQIRTQLVEMFAAHGAASNQIGRAYPYLASLRPETRRAVVALKRVLDPQGLMNPGVLGLP
jgi:FAD/FMN-containing dehydrogenase